MGSETRRDPILCQARELVLERQDANASHLLLWLRLRLRLHDGEALLRTWWEVRFPRPVWTLWGIRFRLFRGRRRPRSGPGRGRPSRQRKPDRGHGDLGPRWTIEDDVDLFSLGARAAA